MKVKTTERGWAGHFIGARECSFRRNTLIEYKDIKVVVSTVGNWTCSIRGGFSEIGVDRFYETMAFMSDIKDEKYHDADVTQEVSFDSEWALGKIDDDNLADEMHENVVSEISNKLLNGTNLKMERE